MADDYKAKLEKFIADIPMPPGQIVSGQAFPAPYTAEFKKKLEDPAFTKTVKTDPLFLKYTRTEHLTLIKNWANGGIMTTCNGLVGLCGAAMGAREFLGQFELEALLRKGGKGHAWVPADSGKRPGYGDVFRPVSYHMGVSLGFDGDDWLTVESGQGGSKMGFDVIKRKTHKFIPSHLLGWCDIRLYLDPRPPVPDWLVGTWVIYCGKDVYSYIINQYYDVAYYPWKMIGGPQKAVPMDTGTVSFQGSDAFTVTWSKEGGAERFKYERFDSFPGIMEKVSGTSSRGEPLKGVRL